MIIREEIIGDCRLIQGDCLEVMPLLGEFDACAMDVPYGVNLGNVKNGQAKRKNQQAYNCFPDTPEYVESVCVKAIQYCADNYRSTAVTIGNRNMFKYPQPADMGVWWNPAGTSRGKWGFNCVVTPIFYYGKDPRAGRGSFPSSPVGIGASREAANIDHPCGKPLSFMKWIVARVSSVGEQVIDPFMGSGTTGVACVKLGRKFTGIELDPDYFDIACRRIEEAYKQPDLFIETEKPKPAQQEALDLEFPNGSGHGDNLAKPVEVSS